MEDTDKDDDGAPVTESLPCAVHSLDLTELRAQCSLGGHLVITRWAEGDSAPWNPALACPAPEEERGSPSL